MAKLPFYKRFPADWLTDPAVSMLTPAARGIWADCVDVMHLGQTHTLSGTPEQLARSCRCTPSEMLNALAEFKTHGVAECAQTRNGQWSIHSKRVKRDMDEREGTRDRKRRSRKRGDVTPMSHECHSDVTGRRQKTEDRREASPLPPCGPPLGDEGVGSDDPSDWPCGPDSLRWHMLGRHNASQAVRRACMDFADHLRGKRNPRVTGPVISMPMWREWGKQLDRLGIEDFERALRTAISKGYQGPQWPDDDGKPERPPVDVGAAVARARERANGGFRCE